MSHKYSKRGIIWEMLEEIPILGELFEKFKHRSDSKGMKKLACCCLPIALILAVPFILIFLWLVKLAISLFKIDTVNATDWIDDTRNWINNLSPFNQISDFLNGAGQWLQSLSQLLP